MNTSDEAVQHVPSACCPVAEAAHLLLMGVHTIISDLRCTFDTFWLDRLDLDRPWKALTGATGTRVTAVDKVAGILTHSSVESDTSRSSVVEDALSDAA